MHKLDPHERPPDRIRNVYKKYQKMGLEQLNGDTEIIDITDDATASSNSKVHVVKQHAAEQLTATFRAFAGQDLVAQGLDLPSSIPVYEHEDMPGLHIIPALLPPEIQSLLLSRLLHRDLSNPTHLTNIHTHYTLTYPPSSPPSSSSFFTNAPTSPHPIAHPLNPDLHTALPIHSLLTKKLRWITLGGQYDWTLKRYPSDPPPPFPADIKHLLEAVFPETRAEAAIVNLYSPNDTLSLHRDVAEHCGSGLVSVSLGCDGVFVVGSSSRVGGEEGEEKEKVITLRLRSGSALYMSGASRFAWHGVPQIVAGTCPEYLKDWPGSADGEGEYEAWEGWMANKRVNLNVRQMWD